MRILAFVVLGCVVGCADPTTNDVLQVTAQATQLSVGGTTVMEADLVDPMTNAKMTTTDVSWSTDPNGVVMLSQQGEVQEVTAIGSGSVVVTVSGFQQTAKIGFTVTP